MTAQDLIRRYQREVPDGHFFDPKTMQFWGSRIHNPLGQAAGKVYFTTSEQFPGAPRRYRARYFDGQGVHSIGPAESQAAARFRLKRALAAAQQAA
jgi:hypothetical protein